jgi:ATP:ADP antiporter, AAA family
MLKTREALILSQGGAEVKSYSAAGQAILLLAVLPLFGAFASRVNRVRLVTGVTLFFASNLVVFIVLGTAGFRGSACPRVREAIAPPAYRSYFL